MGYIVEKKCHAWVGCFFQVKRKGSTTPVYRSEKKKDCIRFVINGIKEID